MLSLSRCSYINVEINHELLHICRCNTTCSLSVFQPLLHSNQEVTHNCNIDEEIRQSKVLSCMRTSILGSRGVKQIIKYVGASGGAASGIVKGDLLPFT